VNAARSLTARDTQRYLHDECGRRKKKKKHKTICGAHRSRRPRSTPCPRSSPSLPGSRLFRHDAAHGRPAECAWPRAAAFVAWKSGPPFASKVAPPAVALALGSGSRSALPLSRRGSARAFAERADNVSRAPTWRSPTRRPPAPLVRPAPPDLSQSSSSVAFALVASSPMTFSTAAGVAEERGDTLMP